jgi:hypothetical protein
VVLSGGAEPQDKGTWVGLEDLLKAGIVDQWVEFFEQQGDFPFGKRHTETGPIGAEEK